MGNTWIYLIKDLVVGCHKIGQSVDPVKRCSDLRKQDTKQVTPNDYILVEAWWSSSEMERKLHGEFHNKRVRGEWFDLDEADLLAIRQTFKAHQPHSTVYNDTFLDGRVQALAETVQDLIETVTEYQSLVYRLNLRMEAITNRLPPEIKEPVSRFNALPSLKTHQNKWGKDAE